MAHDTNPNPNPSPSQKPSDRGRSPGTGVEHPGPAVPASSAPLDIQAFARGMNELLVLAGLRQEPRHGYQIALELEQRSGGLFSLQYGTLYPILHRLEAEGLIEGRWQRRVGRKRKVYELTRSGRRRLEAELERCDEVFRGLLSLVEANADEPVRDETEAGRRGA
jgi:PadR family transcriptional regulator